MLLSTGVTTDMTGLRVGIKGTTGMTGLRVGIKGTTAVTTGALVVGVCGEGTFGLGVTRTGGLGVGTRGLQVVVDGTLMEGVTFFIGGALVGEILLAVTGGLLVVVGLLWSESGILLPPLLLLLGVVFPGRGGSMITFGMGLQSKPMPL